MQKEFPRSAAFFSHISNDVHGGGGDDGGEEEITPPSAFNLFVADAIVVLDCRTTGSEHTPLLPTSMQVVTENDAGVATEGGRFESAANKAFESIVQEYGPEDTSKCLILHSNDAFSKRLAKHSAAALSSSCRRRLLCNDLDKAYPFLFGMEELPIGYPNEITQNLYLGSQLCCSRAQPLDNLGITHVVSILSNAMEPPHGRTHLSIVAEVASSSSFLFFPFYSPFPFISSFHFLLFPFPLLFLFFLFPLPFSSGNTHTLTQHHRTVCRRT